MAVVLKQQHGWTCGMLANHFWSVAGNGPTVTMSTPRSCSRSCPIRRKVHYVRVQHGNHVGPGDGTRFGLLMHHTDAERESAYDRASAIGRLDKALDEAEQHGWTVVDMTQDWEVIYPFEQQ